MIYLIGGVFTEDIKINNKECLIIANKLRLARYAAIVVLTVLVICSIAMLRDEITVENLRYLFKYVDVRTPQLSGEQKQIYYRGNTATKFKMLRNDLAVLNDSGYEVYSFSGRRIMSSDINYANPEIETNGKYSLCFNVGGSELSVYNALSCIYSNNFDYGVYGVSLSDSGAFAVITSDKNYVSGVEVYNKEYSRTFRWMSPDRYCINVCLTDNDKSVACASVYTKQGSYITDICVFNISTGEQRFKCTFENEFPYKILHLRDTYILITDSSAHFIDKNGNEISEFTYYENSLESFYSSDDYIFFSFKNSVLGNENVVTAVDLKGNVVFSKEYVEKVLSLAFDKNYIYVLRKGRLDINEFYFSDNKLITRSSADISVSPDIIQVFSAENGDYVLVSPEGAGKYSAISFISEIPR